MATHPTQVDSMATMDYLVNAFQSAFNRIEAPHHVIMFEWSMACLHRKFQAVGTSQGIDLSWQEGWCHGWLSDCTHTFVLCAYQDHMQQTQRYCTAQSTQLQHCVYTWGLTHNTRLYWRHPRNVAFSMAPASGSTFHPYAAQCSDMILGG